MEFNMTQGLFVVLGVVAAVAVLWMMFRKKEEPSCVECENLENIGYADTPPVVQKPEVTDVVVVDPTTEKPISDAEVADILNILANQKDETVAAEVPVVKAAEVVSAVVPAVKKAKKPRNPKAAVKKPRVKKTK